ncbi:nitroreductase/quinone reductase family protein [Microlunatus speluncae]|uniref:nitroreductase/quinone reductase family protein n=1 Tax=Microlunatus speluncae TaxID=2594267 RepID=UPI0013757268|nr:nitroreductase/quinone reductase family protein [Microlunatus speluncae]
MSRTDSPSTRPAPVRDNSSRGQRRFNRIVRVLLHSPLHGLMSRKLTLLYVTGRKTGTRYAVPTAFTDHAGQVLVASAGSWTRNLSGPEPVELRHHGRRLLATAEVAADRDRAYEIALALLPPNPILRNFVKVDLDGDGRPKQDEFDAARDRGVKFIALHPRG